MVPRLSRQIGQNGNGQRWRDVHMKDLAVEASQADERHGFSERKQQPAWEAELMNPESKLIVSHQQGKRDEALIQRLYADVVPRLAQPHDLVLFTDGEASYDTLVCRVLWHPFYQPSRQGRQLRRPKMRYRIPRTLAHVQIIRRR